MAQAPNTHPPTVGQDEPAEEPASRALRAQFNFTAAVDNTEQGMEQFEAICDAVIAEGTRRGLFYEFGFTQSMEDDQVVPASPLHQALTGAEPAPE